MTNRLGPFQSPNVSCADFNTNKQKDFGGGGVGGEGEALIFALHMLDSALEKLDV